MFFPTFRFRSLIIVALCATLSLASGCSALRIGYATAPDIAYWWFDRYVDFNGSQTPRVREAIAEWFAWNRQTQVPEYAAQLVKARAEVLVDTTPARVCAWQQEILKRAHVAFDRFAPAAAELMVTITPEQIRHLERRYEKFNEDFRDDYLQADPRKRARETLKRVVERTETLYGKLDDAQRDRIAETLTRSPFDPELWLAERKLRQQDALQILRKVTSEGASRDEAQAALRGYVDRLERSPRENYRRYFARLTEFNCAFAASIHNGTTAAQRNTAAKRIAGWEGDLRHIATAAPAATVADPAGN